VALDLLCSVPRRSAVLAQAALDLVARAADAAGVDALAAVAQVVQTLVDRQREEVRVAKATSLKIGNAAGSMRRSRWHIAGRIDRVKQLNRSP